jgi:hypothetical protein
VIVVFDKGIDLKFSHGIPAGAMGFGATGGGDCGRLSTADPDSIAEIEMVKSSFMI